MLDILLNSRLVNKYLKKALERYLNKDLGDDMRVVVHDLTIIERNGYFSANVDADIDITKEAAKQIIMKQ